MVEQEIKKGDVMGPWHLGKRQQLLQLESRDFQLMLQCIEKKHPPADVVVGFGAVTKKKLHCDIVRQQRSIQGVQQQHKMLGKML